MNAVVGSAGTEYACPQCGLPVPVYRFSTERLRRLGWRAPNPISFENYCRHPQKVIPWPLGASTGMWTLLPLVGTTNSMGALTVQSREEIQFFAANLATMRQIEGDPALQAEARLPAKLAEIEVWGDEATCRLCGKRRPLEDEHAPSRASGNRGRMTGGRIDEAETRRRGTLVWEWERVEGGATFKALCKRCNNGTGGKYNPSYLIFAEQCRPQARAETAGTFCSIPVTTQLRLVAKQALTWLVATSQPGVTERFQHLRALLKSSPARGPLAPLRLWAHLVANPGVTWYTGIVGAFNVEQKRSRLVASLALWPLSWMLTFDDEVEIDGAVDVSDWLQLDKRVQPTTVSLPCRWRVTKYPDDFRSPAQVLSEAAAEASRNHPLFR